MNRIVLIAVDVQHDFIDGTMGAPDRYQVITPIWNTSAYADLVIASGDAHPPNHFSFVEHGGIWPTHCVGGFPGARIHPWIWSRANHIIWKGMQPDVEALSAFDGLETHGMLLDDLLLPDDELVICGLCTDYCVKATVMDALERGYNVTVPVTSHCRGVTSVTSRRASVEMREAGAKIL